MNKTGLIIGISGKIGTGKDTVAREIIKNFPEYEFKQAHFGYNVKKIVSLLTGIDMRTILSRKIKNVFLPEWNMTVGEMFQVIGTKVIRDNFDKEVWIKSLFSNIKNGQNIIIPDLRFENEAEAILNRGGYVIRLLGDPKKIRENDKRDPNCESETGLDNYDKFDIYYENNPPIENLKGLMSEIKSKFNL